MFPNWFASSLLPCTDSVEEMIKFWLYLKGLGLFPYCGYWCCRRCCYILLNITMVFEFLKFIGILRQLVSTGCSSKIYTYIRAVSSYSLWYLVSEVKVSLHIWICCNIQIFIRKGCLIILKMLLKLIHFKSLIVGWRGLVLDIFLIACHFYSKVDTLLFFILQFFAAFTPYRTTIVWMREI